VNRVDNDEGLRCQAECWGESPSTLLIDNEDNTCCGDCEYVIVTFEGIEIEHDPADWAEPDFEAIIERRRQDPDPDFHDSNFYDITTGSR